MVGEDTSQPPPPPITSTEAPQMVSCVKLPILKKDEYILWTIKIEQYLAHTDYAMWGNLECTKERKLKSTLLMAIPDEHLARFHGIKDAKTLWAAIKTRFGGSSGSSLKLQNVAFVSAETTSNTNELNAAYSVSTATSHSSQAHGSSSYADGLIGHFSKDCRTTRNSGNMSRDARNAGYRGKDNEDEATDFALMAFTSNPSSSLSSNFERKKLRKANLEIVGYQYGLESIEGILCIHQKNEVIYEEKIGVLQYEVKDKSNLLKYTQKQLDEALREKEDLKAKLKKFETSLKNLTKLLDSPINAKVKTGLGYDSQFNEKEVLDVKEEEVTKTVFDNRSKKTNEVRTSAPLIQDWDTDSDNDNVFRPTHIPSKIDFVKAGESVKPIKSIKHVKPVKPVEQIKKSKNFSSSPTVDRKD
nr:hypothetical protein [Tanacetum cinerariifolium]